MDMKLFWLQQKMTQIQAKSNKKWASIKNDSQKLRKQAKEKSKNLEIEHII